MKTIWKYPLNVMDGEKEIEIPKGAMITDFFHQNPDGDNPTFWAIVDTEAKMIKWKIHIYGTGHEIPDVFPPHALIGSLPFMNGKLIFHFFYEELK